MLFSEFITNTLHGLRIYPVWPPENKPDDVQRFWLARGKREFKQHDIRTTYGPNMFISWAALHKQPPDDNSVYRVSWNTMKHIEIMCFGMSPVDSHLEGVYSSIADLPEWVREAVTVLSILPVPPPPTNVEGVGQRIGETTYWLYHP